MKKTAPYQSSPLLTRAGFRHAFFGRQGGVSDGVFESFNFASGTGDNEDKILANLAIAGRSLKAPSEKIYFLNQVHGIDHLVVDGTEDRKSTARIDGDLVLTKTRDVVAAIRTADCVPVLLACPDSGWIAACHSGWQGCVQGAASETVRTLKAKGAQRLLAAIGPHISFSSFEVSEEVAEELISASVDKDIVDRSGERPHINLRKMVRSQLRSSGLLDDDIDDVEGCTVQQSSRYFSFRRDKNPSGRMLSAIVGR